MWSFVNASRDLEIEKITVTPANSMSGKGSYGIEGHFKVFLKVVESFLGHL